MMLKLQKMEVLKSVKTRWNLGRKACVEVIVMIRTATNGYLTDCGAELTSGGMRQVKAQLILIV